MNECGQNESCAVVLEVFEIGEAHGGAPFLDELGTAPASLQATLLRAVLLCGASIDLEHLPLEIDPKTLYRLLKKHGIFAAGEG